MSAACLLGWELDVSEILKIQVSASVWGKWGASASQKKWIAISVRGGIGRARKSEKENCRVCWGGYWPKTTVTLRTAGCRPGGARFNRATTIRRPTLRMAACVVLIPRDWPHRFQHSRLGWPVMEEAASTWGQTKYTCSVAAHRWNLVRGDDLKVCPTECTWQFRILFQISKLTALTSLLPRFTRCHCIGGWTSKALLLWYKSAVFKSYSNAGKLSHLYIILFLCYEHIELPAKLLDYFLRSNKSNINQSVKRDVRALSFEL